jgi:hypothetical protein
VSHISGTICQPISLAATLATFRKHLQTRLSDAIVTLQLNSCLASGPEAPVKLAYMVQYKSAYYYYYYYYFIIIIMADVAWSLYMLQEELCWTGFLLPTLTVLKNKLHKVLT